MGTPTRRAGWSSEKGSTTARGLGYEWQKLRLLVMQRDSGLCQPCRRQGRTTQATEVDHINPRANGVDNSLSNAQAICHACHEVKTAADNGWRRTQAIGADGWPVD